MTRSGSRIIVVLDYHITNLQLSYYYWQYKLLLLLILLIKRQLDCLWSFCRCIIIQINYFDIIIVS